MPNVASFRKLLSFIFCLFQQTKSGETAIFQLNLSARSEKKLQFSITVVLQKISFGCFCTAVLDETERGRAHRGSNGRNNVLQRQAQMVVASNNYI